MKKNGMFRLFCFLLTLCMVVGCLFTLASCNGDKEKSGLNEGTDEEDTGSETVDPESEEARYRPENIDFGGIEYKWLVRENVREQSVYVYEGDGSPTQVCDYALFCRQAFLEESHGLITTIINEGSAAPNKLSNAILAGEKDYCHGASLGAQSWAPLAASGYLMDLNTLDELNLEASYWDQRIQKEFNINGHLFALEGEFNYIDDLFTYVVIYNDTVWGDLGFSSQYGTPYQLAAEGKWTYEMMMTMIKDASHEINADGVMDENDFWGFVSESIVPYYFFLGAGNKYIVNNEGAIDFAAADSGIWQLNYDVLSNLMKMGENKDVFIADRDCTSATDVWEAASNIFSTNRALFRSTALSATMRLLDMSDDYGIMPIPNYTESQGEYYCWSIGHTFSIPSNLSDPHQAAQMIELICYYSLYMGGDSLNYAFYDLLAFARLCRSQDDVDMLKLVFANKTFDIDYAAKLTGTRDMVSSMVKNNEYTALFSSLTSLKESASDKIKDFVINVESKLPKTN